jgi:putative ABC transport system substrate-binding protein
LPPARRGCVKTATTTRPVVALDLESDPVKSGLVKSIARPGGNLTGLFFDFPGFSAKWLQLLAYGDSYSLGASHTGL